MHESITIETTPTYLYHSLCVTLLDIHVQRFTTLYDDDKRPSLYHVSHDNISFNHIPCFNRLSFPISYHVLPITISNPIPSKFHPLSSSTASAFFTGKMGYSPTVRACGVFGGGGGRRRTCRSGHSGTKRLNERYPVEKEVTTHVSFGDQTWAGVSPQKQNSTGRSGEVNSICYVKGRVGCIYIICTGGIAQAEQ